jgi:hypothetical protein
MAKKLGDIAIGLIILSFLLTGFNIIISDVEESLGLNSSYVDSTLISVGSGTQGDSEDMISHFASASDSTAEADILGGSQLEVRGAGASGLVNRDSKNMLTSFISNLRVQFPIVSNIVFSLMLALITTIITILALRFFWGENRI